MMREGIRYEFLLDRRRSKQRLPIVHIDAESRTSGTSLGAACVKDRIAVLDTGSDSTWFPRSWLEALCIYGQPEDTDDQDVCTISGPAQVKVGIWNLRLYINGVEISENVPVRCPTSSLVPGLPFVVIGQDVLSKFALYHNVLHCRGWLKEVPRSFLARLLWRLCDL